MRNVLTLAIALISLVAATTTSAQNLALGNSETLTHRYRDSSITTARSTSAGGSITSNMEITKIQRHGAGGRFTIRFMLPSSGRLSMKLYNALGDEVRSLLGGDAGERGENLRVIETGYLPAGNYHITLIQDGRSTSQAVTIQR